MHFFALGPDPRVPIMRLKRPNLRNTLYILVGTQQLFNSKSFLHQRHGSEFGSNCPTWHDNTHLNGHSLEWSESQSVISSYRHERESALPKRNYPASLHV